ncbi:nuclear transport factor 2 family protein [Pararhizobium sp. LjRoot238]|uniref:nuclear transport factor 2 family protein n=1 Tax=Pararhizobium sp. LjRoot238 TaxID=3342293 RepID=UPI003ECF62EA
MTSIREEYASRALPKKTLLGFGFFLALTGAAIAQSATPLPAVVPTKCVDSGDYLFRVTNPPPADRQLIMDLIHRYLWALDEGTVVGMDEMLLANVAYELCNGALDQFERKSSDDELTAYLRAINTESKRSAFKTRHFESNTLLHAIDADTVEGKTALLVTVQFAAVETPTLDYTATLESTFQKEGDVWKFAKLRLITDGAEVVLRAR